MQPEHLSRYALDKALAGEGERPAHLDTCAECTEKLEALAKEREVFAASAPPLRAPRRISPMVWGGLALAAALLLFLRFRANDDSERTKGGERLGFYVNHAGAVRLGAEGEHVAPGDGLRFVVTAAAPRYVAVLSVDGKKQVSVYFEGGPVSGPLPQSTTLDDTLGDETLYGVFCPSPVAIAPLRRTLEAGGPLAAPDGCEVDTLHVRKEP